MTVREMTVEDLEQVLLIENELFSVPWDRNGFFTWLTREDTLFLVAEEKGKILGYCGLIMVLDEGDITNVAVTGKRQREGIGEFLVKSLLMLAKQMEIRLVHLEVRQSNESAIRLYHRLGFIDDGFRKNYYTEPAEGAVLMSVSL